MINLPCSTELLLAFWSLPTQLCRYDWTQQVTLTALEIKPAKTKSSSKYDKIQYSERIQREVSTRSLKIETTITKSFGIGFKLPFWES